MERIIIGLNEITIGKVYSLMSLTKEPNKARIISDAIDIYHHLIEDVSNGYEVYTEHKNGIRNKLIFKL